MSFGAGKVQIDFVADDSQFAERTANVKRILANMGEQAGVSAMTIKRALFAAGGQFQYFAMHVASGGSAITALTGGILSLGYVFKDLIIPIMAGMTVLNLLRRVFEANAAKAKEMAEQTKKAAEEAKKLRLEHIETSEMKAELPGIGEPGAIEKRKEVIERLKQELSATWETYFGKAGEGRIGAQEKVVAQLERGVSMVRSGDIIGMERALKKLAEAKEHLSELENPQGWLTERNRLVGTMDALKAEINAERDLTYIREGAIYDLEEQKKALQELLGVEEERGAALKERAPVRATAQFVGAAELWKQTQASVAGSGAREQLQAIKEGVGVQKEIRRAIETLDKHIGNLKETSGPARFTE